MIRQISCVDFADSSLEDRKFDLTLCKYEKKQQFAWQLSAVSISSVYNLVHCKISPGSNIIYQVVMSYYFHIFFKWWEIWRPSVFLTACWRSTEALECMNYWCEIVFPLQWELTGSEIHSFRKSWQLITSIGEIFHDFKTLVEVDSSVQCGEDGGFILTHKSGVSCLL